MGGSCSTVPGVFIAPPPQVQRIGVFTAFSQNGQPRARGFYVADPFFIRAKE